MKPYELKIEKSALRQLDKLDNKTKSMLTNWIGNNLAECESPKTLPNAKPLTGKKDVWRYRVGTYRILALIQDEVITITVFRIAHRKEAYGAEK